MFGLLAYWKLIICGVGLVAGSLFAGYKLLSKEVKESYHHKYSDDALPLDKCLAKAVGSKQENLCYLKNKEGILREEK